MKRWLLLLLLIIPTSTYAQEYIPWLYSLGENENNDSHKGFSLGVHSAGVAEIDASVRWQEHRLHLGLTVGWSSPYEDRVSELITNDSRVRLDKTGYFLRTGDIGYSRFLTERINIKMDLSIGSKTHFTNYSEEGEDGRVYYSYIHSNRFVIGGGIYFGYCITRLIEVYAGYSSLREAGGGIRFNL